MNENELLTYEDVALIIEAATGDRPTRDRFNGWCRRKRLEAIKVPGILTNNYEWRAFARSVAEFELPKAGRPPKESQ